MTNYLLQAAAVHVYYASIPVFEWTTLDVNMHRERDDKGLNYDDMAASTTVMQVASGSP